MKRNNPIGTAIRYEAATWHNVWMARHGREIDDEMRAVGAAVIAEQHREYYAGAHGLSIELDGRHTRKGYADLQFNQATGWKAAVEKIQY